MVIYLYGSDSYRRQIKLNEYLDRYNAKFKGFSLRRFDFENKEEWRDFNDFTKSRSLFESSGMGIVSGVFNLSKSELKEFLKILKDNLASKDLTIIFLDDKKPLKDFSFLLKSPAVSHAFENLSGQEFQNFIKEEAGKRGINLDIGAQYLLMQAFSGNSWGLVTELDKLALSGKGEVSRRAVEKYSDASAPLNIFSAINKLRDFKDFGLRLSALEELLSSQDTAMVFNILAASPYADPAWKIKMADFDAAIKSGKLEYEEVLTDIALT